MAAACDVSSLISYSKWESPKLPCIISVARRGNVDLNLFQYHTSVLCSVIYFSLCLLCLVARACVERFYFHFDSVKAASCPLLHYLPEISEVTQRGCK